MKICDLCNYENNENASICEICGKDFGSGEEIICNNCHYINVPNSNICAHCKESLNATATLKRERNNIKLWNPTALAAISVFFTFLPASIFYSINLGRLGTKRKRNLALLLSFLLFACAVTALIILPVDSYIGKAIFLGLNIGYAIWIENTQKPLYKAHIQNGNKKASIFLPLTTAILFTGLLLFLVIKAGLPSNYKIYNGDYLFYTGRTDMSDVNKLGDYLTENKIFIANGKTICVRIDKNNDKYIISFICDEKDIKEQNITVFSILSADVSTKVFSKKKVEIDLCNEDFKAWKTI